MRRLRALSVALVIPVLVLSVFLVSNVLAAPAGKVTLCHWANHKYVEITISQNAVPAHLAHGDVMPDQYGNCP